MPIIKVARTSNSPTLCRVSSCLMPLRHPLRIFRLCSAESITSLRKFSLRLGVSRQRAELRRVFHHCRRAVFLAECEADGPVEDRQGEDDYDGDVDPVRQDTFRAVAVATEQADEDVPAEPRRDPERVSDRALCAGSSTPRSNREQDETNTDGADEFPGRVEPTPVNDEVG